MIRRFGARSRWPTSITLKVVHDIIQAVMRWFDYHLWEFTIGKQKYGLPMDEHGGAGNLMASKVRLRDVLQPRKTVLDYTMLTIGVADNKTFRYLRD